MQDNLQRSWGVGFRERQHDLSCRGSLSLSFIDAARLGTLLEEDLGVRSCSLQLCKKQDLTPCLRFFWGGETGTLVQSELIVRAINPSSYSIPPYERRSTRFSRVDHRMAKGK